MMEDSKRGKRGSKKECRVRTGEKGGHLFFIVRIFFIVLINIWLLISSNRGLSNKVNPC
jgi:hypothetical protein